MTTGLVQHVCSIYRADQQLRTTARAFLADGAALGQKPILIGPGPVDALRAAVLGPDSPIEVEARSTEDVYGPGSLIDPEPTLAAFEATLEDALDEGYRGLRVVALLSTKVTDPAAARSVARWEHIAGRWQSSQPVASICAYDRRAVDPAILAPIACLHPSVDAPTDLCPFRLFARDGELTLTGVIDAQSAPLLARVLAAVEVEPGERLVLDASGLEFIDHRGLLTIFEHLRRERPAGVTLLGAPAFASRLSGLLGLEPDELELRP